MTAPEGWTLEQGGLVLRREWLMKDFAAAIAFIDDMAARAEAADHHPDFHLTGYRRLVVELTTHSAGKLTEKDYALAAELEQLPKSLKV